MVERLNGTLVNIIKELAADESDSWDEYLLSSTLEYRFQPIKQPSYPPSRCYMVETSVS